MAKVSTTQAKNRVLIEKITKDAERIYRVGKDAHLDLVLLFTGRKNLTASATIKLAAAGASAQILGFVLGRGERKTEFHSLQLHAARQTTSNLLIKSVLSDTSAFFYDGGIRVTKEAQKTDAYQRNENLLLSKSTHVESKPKLEILANDVRCTHGATTSTVSAEELWYLASRGIDPATGRELLVEGFLEHAILQISDKMAQDKVRRTLWQIMSK